MSFPLGTEIFQFPRFASFTYVFSKGYHLRGGFPHSDIFGSKSIGNSPKLFAAYHVFHRLPSPRHPLNALIILVLTSQIHPQGQVYLSASYSLNSVYLQRLYRLTPGKLSFSPALPAVRSMSPSRREPINSPNQSQLSTRKMH